MASVHSGSIKSFFNALAEAKAVSSADIAEMRAWIDNYKVPLAAEKSAELEAEKAALSEV
jgi:hypothetical protein